MCLTNLTPSILVSIYLKQAIFMNIILIYFDAVEAIHLANLLCQHGYFFPVGDNRNLSVKDDSSLYRFQVRLLAVIDFEAIRLFGSH